MIEQYGVLPYRIDASGQLSILLITSRETGRWIVPKGNPIPGLSPAEAARREAQEEAGVDGEVGDSAIGRYGYIKRRRSGETVPAEVQLFPLLVTRQLDDWPEREERAIKWFAQNEAAGAVAEPDLSALILSFRPPA